MQGSLTANQATLGTASRGDRRAIVIALFLGAIAALLTFAYLRSVASRAEVVAGTLPVVVASRDLEAGERVSDAMIEVKMLPEAAIVSTAFRAKEQVVGQSLRYPVSRGEQLTSARLIETAKVPA